MVIPCTSWSKVDVIGSPAVDSPGLGRGSRQFRQGVSIRGNRETNVLERATRGDHPAVDRCERSLVARMVFLTVNDGLPVVPHVLPLDLAVVGMTLTDKEFWIV